MKNLYTLTLKNAQGQIRTVEVAGNSLMHALNRLDDRNGMSTSDTLKDYSYKPLPW